MATRIFIDHTWQDGSRTHCEVRPELLLDTDQLLEGTAAVIGMFTQAANILMFEDQVDIDEDDELRG